MSATALDGGQVIHTVQEVPAGELPILHLLILLCLPLSVVLVSA